MPEAKDGKAEPLIPCPSCGRQGQVRRTGQFLQCSGHYEKFTNLNGKEIDVWVNAGCGHGDLEHKFLKKAQGLKGGGNGGL